MISWTFLFSIFIRGVFCLDQNQNKIYVIGSWNKCHALPFTEIHTSDLTNCVLECGYRHLCIGVQYSRMRKLCGILTQTEMVNALGYCRNYVYIPRNKMTLIFTYEKLTKFTETASWYVYFQKTGECGPYERSEATNTCILECIVSENPRNFSDLITNIVPALDTKVKITCLTPPVQMYVTCGRNGTFDKLPNCDPYIGQNIAFNRPTRQISTYYNATSDKAVDTIISTSYYDNGCTHTSDIAHPWLIIQLDHLFYLQTVEILGRTDRCCSHRFTEVYIFTSESEAELTSETDWDAGSLCAYRQGPFTEHPVIFNCIDDVRGKFVKITLNKTTALELCDVKVFGYLPKPIL